MSKTFLPDLCFGGFAGTVLIAGYSLADQPYWVLFIPIIPASLILVALQTWRDHERDADE